jgi:hypothetical protein
VWFLEEAVVDGVIQVVECIRSIQGANVDCSIRQGRDKVLDQFLLSFGIASEQDIVNLEDALVELPSWVAPLNLPDDYLFFQEFYGGLGIHTPAYYFDVMGIGPMRDDWYGDVVRDDDAIYENGLLLIGTLAYGSNPRRFVRFFLDLAGVIDQGCIYAVGPPESTRSSNALDQGRQHVYRVARDRGRDQRSVWVCMTR